MHKMFLLLVKIAFLLTSNHVNEVYIITTTNHKNHSLFEYDATKFGGKVILYPKAGGRRVLKNFGIHPPNDKPSRPRKL
jgi:hypothetical protein